jgi:hypothetical protein
VDVAEARDQDSCPSSPNPSDDDGVSEDDTTVGGGIDPYRLGQRIAMEMDEDAIRLEVARQFGADRQRRAARRRPVAAPAPPRVRFSLRLSEEEIMEDIAAVSPENIQQEAPTGHGNRKGRRGRGG